MSKLELLYANRDKFKVLTLDNMLAELDVSHEEYRKFLHTRGYEQYTPTRGMMAEILYDETLTPGKAARKYYLEQADVQRIFYRNAADQTGVDEALLVKLSAAGAKNVDLAQQFNISPSRVSQIRQKHGLTPPRKPRKQLDSFKKLDAFNDLQHLTPLQVAIKYDIGIATVYRIKACKSL